MCIMKYIIIFSIIIFSSCLNQMAKKAEKADEYRGIITNIYRDINNHNMNTFSVNTFSGKTNITADLYSDSAKFASIGDSIIKPKNELYIIIKKKSGDQQKFQYR